MPIFQSFLVKGAAIWLDDRNTERVTDTVLEVISGKHTIVLMRDGYKKAKKEVELSPKQFLEVEFRLEKANLSVASMAHSRGIVPLDWSFFPKKQNDSAQHSLHLPPTTSSKMHTHGRYVVLSDNIVKDTKTGLEWLSGPDKDTTWDEAKSWVAGLKTGGGGWRMPSMAELEGIYEKGLGELLKITGWWVWSCETHEVSSTARNFLFDTGYRVWVDRSTSNGGRGFAVRSRSGR